MMIPGPSLRVLIADDEPIARRRLARMLLRLGEVEILGQAEDCDQTVARVRQLRPDLLFLDVEMPGGDGFEVLERLGSDLPLVVFVTAFDHYALRAFEMAALDYITKPVEMARLAAAMARGRKAVIASDQDERIAELQAAIVTLRSALRKARNPAADLWVRSNGSSLRMSIENIAYIRAERDYVRIFTDGASYLIAGSIGSMEKRTAELGFLRIHRSTLVRQAAIRSIIRRRYGMQIVRLADGTELNIGRSYAERLAHALNLAPPP